MPLPVMRIAPNPRRFTDRSPPSWNVPLCAALRVAVVIEGSLRLCSLVLIRPRNVYAEDVRGVERPVRIAQQFPGQKNGVRGTAADDLVGLMRIRDQANGAGGDAGLGADRAREWHLVAGTELDFRAGHRAAAGAVDQIDAEVAQTLREF